MSRIDIEELRHERAELVDQMRELNELAEGEQRDFTGEESEKYEKLEAAFESLTRRIERQEKLEGIEPRMTSAIARRDELPVEPEPELELESRYGDIAPGEEAYQRYIRRDFEGMSPEVRAAMQVGTDAEGGYTVQEVWVSTLVESLREFNIMRQHATIFRTASADKVHVPKVDAAGTAAIVAEEAAFAQSEDTFTEVVFDAWKFGTLIKASDELVSDSLFDINAFVNRRAGQAIALAEGSDFIIGTGSSQPNGIFTAATTGKTAASSATVTANELIDLYHSVLAPYRRNASWIMRDASAQIIRKLLDAGSQDYVWQPGLQAGQPDLLLGRPVLTDPDAPAFGATSVDTILFGDLSGYWIRDVEGVQVKFLSELYAANGQVGWRVSKRSDGDLVDTAAVRVLTTAAT